MKIYRNGDWIYYENGSDIFYLTDKRIDVYDKGGGDVTIAVDPISRSFKSTTLPVTDITDESGDPYSSADQLIGLISTLSNGLVISSDNARHDAFGRLRVSTPDTIFDNKSLYSKSTSTYWDEVENGSGSSTHDPDNACVNMSVAGSGDYVIRQTRQHINYQSGKSQLYYMTGIIGTPQAGIDAKIGPFQGGTSAPYTAYDGLCFESVSASSEMSVTIYKDGARSQTVTQSNWNKDTMDGNGSSGITIDWSKAQIFVLDFEWLGVGRVRFGLNVDGVTHYVHEFKNANIVDNVYMRSPNQPIRYELRSQGPAASMKEICVSVQSEGGFNARGLQASLGTGINTITIGNTWELLYGLRLKPDELDATVLIESISTIAVSSGDYEYGLFWNPVIAGTPAWTDLTGAALQEFVGDGTTHNITPVITMWSGYNSSDTDAQIVDIRTSLNLGSTIDGSQDVIALGCRTFSGSDDFAGSLIVRQLT